MKTIEAKIRKCQKRIIHWNREISKLPHLNKHREEKHNLFERFLKYKQNAIHKIFELQEQQNDEKRKRQNSIPA